MKKQEVGYQEQVTKNTELFYTLLKQVRPDLYVLADLVDTNNVNIYIVFKFIRHLLNIAQGSHWGKINVFIKDNKVFTIEGVDLDKVDENIFRGT